MSRVLLYPNPIARDRLNVCLDIEDFVETMQKNADMVAGQQLESALQGFKTQLGRFRRDQRIPQKRLSDLVGCSDHSISNWETKPEAFPGLRDFVGLCCALGVTPNDLLNWPNPEQDSFPASKELLGIIEALKAAAERIEKGLEIKEK